jgi:hypothetical protein
LTPKTETARKLQILKTKFLKRKSNYPRLSSIESKIQDSGNDFLIVGSAESTISTDFTVCGVVDVRGGGAGDVIIKFGGIVPPLLL